MALIAAFYAVFAVFSVHVKQDVAQAEAFDAFQSGLSSGQAPPAFELAALDGTTFELESVIDDGDLVLLNFWATWCGPCRLEIPILDNLYERYRDKGLRVLAIDVEEEKATVEAYLREGPVSFPVLLDSDGAVAKRYRIDAFPTTLLVDSDGEIVEVLEGLDPYLGYRIEMHLESADEADEVDDAS